ncbi:MAG TPA: LLM class F420-dependent oxidoreductase [Candidatus Dormibacteraeota bacterium]|nr:LLM class F420-dependent oxidoreductase [Candidatus Dormibacteraeota bacterium]
MLGVLFPQMEFGDDPIAIKEYAQTAEGLGYESLGVYDHVLSARPEGRDEPSVAYFHQQAFHEPFVLFGYLAGVTQRLVLVTKVLTLPERPTALVAKQAAEVDVLSGGRMRLGVGVGWNTVDFEGMNADFRTRATRMEEQIEVLRLLWTNQFVTFDGKYHRISDAGINPMPIQRPIPIWIAGQSDAALRGVARLADGWFPGGGVVTPFQLQPARSEGWDVSVARMRDLARDFGRDPKTIGIEFTVGGAEGTPDDWIADAEECRGFGATHIRLTTMGAGLTSPSSHIEAIRRFWESVSPWLRAQ